MFYLSLKIGQGVIMGGEASCGKDFFPNNGFRDIASGIPRGHAAALCLAAHNSETIDFTLTQLYIAQLATNYKATFWLSWIFVFLFWSRDLLTYFWRGILTSSTQKVKILSDLCTFCVQNMTTKRTDVWPKQTNCLHVSMFPTSLSLLDQKIWAKMYVHVEETSS